ncbi:MAG: 50S ribosomal protein L11 methyltransferase [Megasphaera sp.]|jgi:ribosomal protein L11 methyltransferase|nr:50S ribosomal protein L11 methyltransferase [Megasphaera sp.]MCI1247736.1 50S ribosomal protein L11 methyltransferase [Megasphaera sp.]
MKWNEVDVIVSPRVTDLVALLLYECGSHGSVIHDDEKDEQGCIRITAYFPADVKNIRETIDEHMKQLQERTPDFGSWRMLQQDADDSSWLYVWQDYFHPIKVSSRFWVEPAWEKAVPEPGEQVITIDPGVAFGSGVHDTTAMCIRYLEQTVKSGDLVFDIGTGTGILAIAAAKLGAYHVSAVDFDEKAVQQANINVALNGCESVVEVIDSNLLAAVSQGKRKADVIVANLVTNAVLDLLPTVGAYMHKGSILIVSGIIDERIDEVRRAAIPAGFDSENETAQGGWYAVCLRRK